MVFEANLSIQKQNENLSNKAWKTYKSEDPNPVKVYSFKRSISTNQINQNLRMQHNLTYLKMY